MEDSDKDCEKEDGRSDADQRWLDRSNAEQQARLDETVTRAACNIEFARQGFGATEINRWQATRCTEEFTTYADRLKLAKDFTVALIGKVTSESEPGLIPTTAVLMADALLDKLGPRPPSYQPVLEELEEDGDE